jgi:hypothetical protein
MTRLFNDPAKFRDELIDGFVAAHSRGCDGFRAAWRGAPALLRAGWPWS